MHHYWLSWNITLKNFLIWIKGSHQSPNFETSKPQVVSPQMLHHSSVSWQITPLYFFRWNIFYTKGTNQIWNFGNFECSGQNLPNACDFWNNNSVFLQILHHSSVSSDITPLYFLSWNFIYFQQKEAIKVQIWWNFTWAVKNLKFYTLMCSFCPNYIKFQLKKYRRVISHDTEVRCKVKKK